MITNDKNELNKLDDNELMRLVKKMDQWAMLELYRRHYRFVLGILKIYLTRANELDQCYNDIMFNVWRNAQYFTPNSNFRAWLHQVCHKELRRSIPQDKKHEPVIKDKDQAKALVDAVDRLQLWRRFNAVISALPRKQRTFMELYIATGSIDGAAQVMGINRESAKSLYQRARGKIQDVDNKLLKIASIINY